MRSHSQLSELPDEALAGAKVTLSDAALQEFHSIGFVRLKGAVPPNEVGTMEDAVWRLLEQRGLFQNDPSSWQFDSSAKAIQDLHQVTKLNELKTDESSPEDYPMVREALDAVFGDQQRAAAANWGQPLVTFPHRNGPWMMPNTIWHFDHHYFKTRAINGINVFLFINDVDAEGGGMVVVKSSPLLMDRLLESGAKLSKMNEQNKMFLNSHSWLRGLKTSRNNLSVDRNQRYMDADTNIEGIPARVVELTGKAGDVFLCHPALFHAPAPNVSDQPRLMRTQRVYTQATRDYIKGTGRKSKDTD